MFVLKGFTFFVIFTVSVNSQSCKTPTGEKGNCVPDKECVIHLDLINSSEPLPSRAVDYINRSHCSTKNDQRFVCCANRHLVNKIGNYENDPPILYPSDEEQPTGTEKPLDTVTPTIFNISSTPKIMSDRIANHPNFNLLPLTKCGRNEAERTFGSNHNLTELKEYPWMVLLEYKTNTDQKFLCGGSLINSRYVLTAAHCVTQTPSPLTSVRLGEYNIDTEKDCVPFYDLELCNPPAEDVGIEEVIFHPNYSQKILNDIALIRLERDVEIDADKIDPICLPLTLEAQNYQLATAFIAGWGTTEKRVPSNILGKAKIPVVANERCEQVYSGDKIQLGPGQLCAGGENFVDSCDGDSGGPLFFATPSEEYRYIQYGIVSAGESICGGDGRQNFPGIYSRVTNYLEWILDNLKP